MIEKLAKDEKLSGRFFIYKNEIENRNRVEYGPNFIH